MSCNIRSVRVRTLNAWIAHADLLQLYADVAHRLPEDNFVSDHVRRPPDVEGHVRLTGFEWRGDWSGARFELLTERIAPLVKGTVEVVFVWEEGELSGLLIEDGRVALCSVDPVPIRPAGWPVPPPAGGGKP